MLTSGFTDGQDQARDQGALWLRPLEHPGRAPAARCAALEAALDDDTPVVWSDEDIVLLHWRLLQGVRRLGNPRVPLDEKIDTLRWVFTDPTRDAMPFSFVNCLTVVGRSPLSPAPYMGGIDADAIRRWIGRHLRQWFAKTLEAYPPWVRQSLVDHPTWVAQRLDSNPQWINEQVRQRHEQGDLFS